MNTPIGIGLEYNSFILWHCPRWLLYPAIVYLTITYCIPLLVLWFEPWDVVVAWPIEQRIGFYRGGALKYVMRMGTKDENVQEIRKGAHYMQKLAEVLQERDDEANRQLDQGCQGA